MEDPLPALDQESAATPARRARGPGRPRSGSRCRPGIGRLAGDQHQTLEPEGEVDPVVGRAWEARPVRPRDGAMRRGPEVGVLLGAVGQDSPSSSGGCVPLIGRCSRITGSPATWARTWSVRGSAGMMSRRPPPHCDAGHNWRHNARVRVSGTGCLGNLRQSSRSGGGAPGTFRPQRGDHPSASTACITERSSSLPTIPSNLPRSGPSASTMNVHGGSAIPNASDHAASRGGPPTGSRASAPSA